MFLWCPYEVARLFVFLQRHNSKVGGDPDIFPWTGLPVDSTPTYRAVEEFIWRSKDWDLYEFYHNWTKRQQKIHIQKSSRHGLVSPHSSRDGEMKEERSGSVLPLAQNRKKKKNAKQGNWPLSLRPAAVPTAPWWLTWFVYSRGVPLDGKTKNIKKW